MNDNYRHVNQEVKNMLLSWEKREPAFDGTIKEGFERRFTVINERDFQKYVPDELKIEFMNTFNKVAEHIEKGRINDGKRPFNNYIVINLDETYIDEVVEIMKRNGHWG